MKKMNRAKLVSIVVGSMVLFGSVWFAPFVTKVAAFDYCNSGTMTMGSGVPDPADNTIDMPVGLNAGACYGPPNPCYAGPFPNGFSLSSESIADAGGASFPLVVTGVTSTVTGPPVYFGTICSGGNVYGQAPMTVKYSLDVSSLPDGNYWFWATGLNFGDQTTAGPVSHPFTVQHAGGGGGGPTTGTGMVFSYNSVTGDPVLGSWSFPAYPSPADDPCVGHGGSCTNVAQGVYTGLSFGGYTFAPGAPSAGFSFRSIGNSPSQSLSASNLTDTWIVYWDPEANLNATPAAVSLSSISPSGSVTVTNNGAPGSSADWTASVSYASGSGWLQLSPGSGSNLVQGASQVMTITANTTGLSNGTYNATINFTGTSSPSGKALSRSVAVTLNVVGAGPVCGNGATEAPETCDDGVANDVCSNTNTPRCSPTCQVQACPPPPSCTFVANPSQIVLPQNSNLVYACTHVTFCSIAGSDGSNYGVTVMTPADIANGSQAVSPGASTTYTLTCAGEVSGNANYTQNLQVQVVVNGPGRIEGPP